MFFIEKWLSIILSFSKFELDKICDMYLKKKLKLQNWSLKHEVEQIFCQINYSTCYSMASILINEIFYRVHYIFMLRDIQKTLKLWQKLQMEKKREVRKKGEDRKKYMIESL